MANARSTPLPPRLSYFIYAAGNSTETVQKALVGLEWVEVHELSAQASANFVWKPDWTRSKRFGLFEPPVSYARSHKSMSRRQVWNHMKAVEPLCTKDSLYTVMSSYYKSTGEDPDLALPPTFLVEPIFVPAPASATDSSNTTSSSTTNREWPGWAAFTAKFNECAADPRLKNLWLAKPVGNNRGIGIEVFNSYEDIRSFLDSKSRSASMGINGTWVMQKYLENPLLYKGRKFDLRVWVLVLDNGEVYVHCPGYVRTSSNAFTLDTTERYVHLTNFCQQVNNKETFGQHEEGNTLRWDDLVTYLDTDVLPSRQAGKAHTESTAPQISTGDRPVSAATTGAEVMWGCGSNGVWGQIRKHVRDSLEALRGRGGSRTQGFEENGFNRKPPPYITLPARKGTTASTALNTSVDSTGQTADGKEEESALNVSSASNVSAPSTASPARSAAAAQTQAQAGPPGSRYRFELLGYDFMISDDFRVHFIEVNTNPSLTYQAGWHETFVDEMMDRTVRLVLGEAWPEAYAGSYIPPAQPEGGWCTGVHPEAGWQHVFNVYTAPLKHAGQAGPAAALAMAGLGAGRATPVKAASARNLHSLTGKAISFGKPFASKVAPAASAHVTTAALGVTAPTGSALKPVQASNELSIAADTKGLALAEPLATRAGEMGESSLSPCTIELQPEEDSTEQAITRSVSAGKVLVAPTASVVAESRGRPPRLSGRLGEHPASPTRHVNTTSSSRAMMRAKSVGALRVGVGSSGSLVPLPTPVVEIGQGLDLNASVGGSVTMGEGRAVGKKSSVSGSSAGRLTPTNTQ